MVEQPAHTRYVWGSTPHPATVPWAPMQEQRFICDGMAGKLARWLRILGFDAEYLNTPDKTMLVRIGRSEGRTVLTRDGRLADRFPSLVFLLSSEDPMEQLRQVKNAFRLPVSPARLGTRCSLCNAPVRPVEKASVRDRVPAYTYERIKTFHECPVCRRVYWRGDHWKRMEQVCLLLRTEGRTDAASA